MLPSALNPISWRQQAENLEEVQRRLQDMGIPFVKQTIFEAGMEVQQVGARGRTREGRRQSNKGSCRATACLYEC